MAIRIQLRRDTAANWVSSNPVLRQGEIGIETDTLQMKLGNGTSTWTQITAYMNLVPDGNLTIGDYVMVNDIGASLGVVGLDNSKNALIPGSSIIVEGATNNSFETTLTVTDPTADRTITFKNADGTVAFVADIPTTTDALAEGATNKYFSDERAQDAVANSLAAGTHTNITVTYNDAANSLSLAAAPGYVDEQAVDAVAAALAAGTHTNISVSYNDAGNAISLTGAQTYNDENAQDAIGNNLGTGLSYNDTTGAISVDSTIATKTYADNAVSTGISNLVASSPATLDTLNELAAALGNDASFSTTVTNSIATKAPIASPTFTGTVSGITKTMVGLANVDNTTDASKPISTATQTALDAKLASATAASTYAPIASPTFTGTVSGVTKSMVGLGNVDNTTDAAKPISTATQTAFDLKAPLASPSLTGVPTAPTAATATNTTQIATTAFVRGEVAALVNGASAALDTLGELAAALTADEATAATLATLVGTKAPIASPTFTGTVSGITKSMVGLGNVDNTSDTSKPISTATQTALDFKAPLASPTFTGIVSGITKTMVGLGNVDNTTDALKPISTATQTALDAKLASATAATTYETITNVALKAPLASPALTGSPTAPTALAADNSTKIATTAYADRAASNATAALVASAPAALDTLNELAAALGNDASFSTTVTNSIATKAPIASPTFTGTVSGITKTMVGLGNVDNTTDALKPISTATQTALDAKLASATAASTYAPIASPTFTGTVSGITKTMVGLGNVENTALSTWAGSSSITTLGTIATGIWSGTAIATTSGGTGLTSYTTGDLLYSSASNTLAKLAAGSNGQILTLAAGVPTWAAAPITLPSQTGNSGKYLTTDGTSASWGTLVVPITTGTATVNQNTAQDVDTIALSAFTSAEYMVSIKQGSKIRTSKVILQTDGTSVDMTEFAITETGGTLAGVVVSATTASSNAKLQVTVTDALSTNATVKFSKIAL